MLAAVLVVAAPLPKASAESCSVVLDPIKSGFDLSFYPDLTDMEIVFKKEPDFRGHEVFRGVLPVGGDRQGYVGLAWDRTTDRLYLDLNRNFDLTDDEPLLPAAERGSWQRTYSNVTIHCEVPVALDYVLDLSFYAHERGTPRCRVLVRSGWHGQWSVAGQVWDVLFADNLDGAVGEDDLFLIMPAQAPVELSLDEEHPYRLRPAKQISLAGVNYDFALRPARGPNAWEAELADHPQPLVPLQLEGRFIRRLILEQGAEGEGRVVVFDGPESGILMVPEGEYGSQRVVVADPDLRHIFTAAANQKLAVSSAKMSVLKIGGPLDNSVRAESSGASLRMDYRLRGQGGEEYERRSGQREAPTVSIYRGDELLAFGAFEFG